MHQELEARKRVPRRQAEDRAAFREAVREYERATLKILGAVRGDVGEISQGKGAA
jgi:hypothetical protein